MLHELTEGVYEGSLHLGVLLDYMEDEGLSFDARWRSSDIADVRAVVDETEGTVECCDGYGYSGCPECHGEGERPNPDCPRVLRWYAAWLRDAGENWRETGIYVTDIVPGLLWLAREGKWPMDSVPSGTGWAGGNQSAPFVLPVHLHDAIGRDPVRFDTVHEALEAAALAAVTLEVDGVPFLDTDGAKT